MCTLSHEKLAAGMPPETAELLRMAMLNEGVDLMGGTGAMTSSVHTEEQLERTVEAFENALSALREEGVVN